MRALDLIGSKYRLAALLLLAFAPPAFAQRVLEVKGFKLADYYPAPHESRMKSLLESATAQPQPDGHTFVNTDNKIQTFNLAGQPELVVHAEHCVYDSVKRCVNSPGPLRMETGDGSFFIEGDGFFWQQTNSVLYISNHVHTIALPDMLSAPGQGAPAKPPVGERGIEIFSDQFNYSADSGLATYRSNVHVTGTNLALSSAILTFKLPVKERQLQSIVAEQNVIVEHNGVQATGDRAFYAVDTGLIRITGHPSWRAGLREGRGDELVIDRTNRIFLARGNAWLKMPGALAKSGMFANVGPADAPQESSQTNQFVEIHCDNYEVRTNSAFFRKRVHVSEIAGDQAKGNLDCGVLNLTFTGTNELQQMSAENNVVFSQPDREMRAGKAVYTAADGLLHLTLKPSWRAGAREGKGDLIVVNSQKNEMTVQGNASMRMPASELGQAGAAEVPRPKGGTNEFAEIFASEYDVRAQNARFHGGVYITHPQMNWACETLTVQLPPEGGRVDSIVADQSVVFDVLDEQGHKVHGVGEKAIYSFDIANNVTNDILRLFGSPATLEATNSTIQNKLIVLDLGKRKLITTGEYSIHGTTPAVDTNNFQLPKSKILK